MSFATRNTCICSSCFKRQHEIIVNDQRHAKSGKRCVIKPWTPSSAKEIEKNVWKVYQEKLKLQVTRGCQRLGKKSIGYIEVVRKICPSEIFVEKPTSANSRSLILDVNCQNFWDFVYGQSWKGRVRVCEGELMYKLRETLKMLVSQEKIAYFTVTRMFTNHEYIVPKSPGLVVRVEQTYYGGVPKKTKKTVRWNLVPDSTFTPRLKCVSPILKNAWDKTATPFLKSKAPDVKRSDMENEPTMRRFSTNGNEPERMFNLSETFAKGDFATICLQATEHFIVVREMVTNSRTMNSSTSFTFRRKENLCGTSKIAKTMNDFYTSETLAENFAKKPEFKPSTPLLEMKI